MRIIENPNPVVETVVTCKYCGCKYAYTKGDMKHESWFNGVIGPGGYGYTKDWVECPNCGEKHIVSEEHSPEYDSLGNIDTESIRAQMESIMAKPIDCEELGDKITTIM